MTKRPIELADLQRLARSESPDLTEALLAFLGYPDPEPEKPAPEGALLPGEFAGLLQQAARKRRRDLRSKASGEAWSRMLAQADPPLPPRFQLGDLLLEMYERGGDGGRRVLIDLLGRVPFKYGVWLGIKRIYKLSEARMDAEVFGVLAARFDAGLSANARERDVSGGTLIYLRRRAWRFLRELGAAVPELYPQFAAEVLRRYGPDTRFHGLWVANHVWSHESKKYNGRSFLGRVPPSDMLKHRAYPEAWKRTPDPLMYLLETCGSDPAASFAIQSLRKDFPDRLRSVTPAWLERLAYRPLESAHDFLVETLQGSPEFHQGKLRALGLHDAVLFLLRSPSGGARKYAIEYARAHAADLPKERLADLLEDTEDEVEQFASQALQARPARELGVEFLGRLLGYSTHGWASKALEASFERREVAEGFLIDMLFGASEQAEWAEQYIAKKYPGGEIGPAFWIKLLDDPRQPNDPGATQVALGALGEMPVASIDARWMLSALTRPRVGQAVGEWLKSADRLEGLDVEKLKGFVFSAQHRDVALAVLGNTRLVRPRELGLGWLLALARRADPTLHQFAHGYLLEHMAPEEFSDAGDRAAGLERLFQLALGDKEPEPVRLFAQTYLRCHHPAIGPEQPESKPFSLTPQLAAADYDPARIWGALFDNRPDVRRFAVAIVRAELRRWGYQGRVYELAESDAKEVRNVAYDALLKAGEPTADPLLALRTDEIDPALVFALTESTRRSTREMAMELIRRHYARLGGAERLGWLMQSADREVRLFAVRLLWEKHRPRAYPPSWKPAKRPAHGGAGDGAKFEDVAALRGLLRRMLFGLPPGRSMEQQDEPGRRRRVAASVVKRNVVELVRDLGVADGAFAHLVSPVLLEFTASLAKGEWQACLAAVMHLQKAHPELSLEG